MDEKVPAGGKDRISGRIEGQEPGGKKQEHSDQRPQNGNVIEQEGGRPSQHRVGEAKRPHQGPCGEPDRRIHHCHDRQLLCGAVLDLFGDFHGLSLFREARQNFDECP